MLSLALLLVAGTGSYHASGTEPFWSLAVGGGQARLEQVGRRKLVMPVRKSRDGRRYVGREVTVHVVRRPCSDGMSDRVFPDTVTVVVGRRRLRGCGGVAARDS